MAGKLIGGGPRRRPEDEGPRPEVVARARLDGDRVVVPDLEVPRGGGLRDVTPYLFPERFVHPGGLGGLRVHDGALPADLCDEVLAAFDESKAAHVDGRVMGGYDPDVKRTVDLQLGRLLDAPGYVEDEAERARLLELWRPLDQRIYRAVFDSFQLYQRTALGLSRVTAPLVDTGYQIQDYEPGVGKFAAHLDSSTFQSACRIAAAVIYFNDAEGGETRFPDWGVEVACVRGRVAWFPAGWTHAHEGLVPRTRKLIASTFMCYRGYGLLLPGGEAHDLLEAAQRDPSCGTA